MVCSWLPIYMCVYIQLETRSLNRSQDGKWPLHYDGQRMFFFFLFRSSSHINDQHISNTEMLALINLLTSAKNLMNKIQFRIWTAVSLSLEISNREQHQHNAANTTIGFHPPTTVCKIARFSLTSTWMSDRLGTHSTP